MKIKILLLSIVCFFALSASAQTKNEVVEKFRTASRINEYIGKPFHLSGELVVDQKYEQFNASFELTYQSLGRFKFSGTALGESIDVVVDGDTGWAAVNNESLYVFTPEDIAEAREGIKSITNLDYDPKQASRYDVLTKFFEIAKVLPSQKIQGVKVNVLQILFDKGEAFVNFNFDQKSGLLSSIVGGNTINESNDQGLVTFNYNKKNKAITTIKLFEKEKGKFLKKPEAVFTFQDVEMIKGQPFAKTVLMKFDDDDDNVKIHFFDFEPDFTIDPSIFIAPDLPLYEEHTDEDLMDSIEDEEIVEEQYDEQE